MEKYTAPDKHRKPVDADKFLASLEPKQRELHEMAEKLLGSSYFMQRSHSYTKWSKQRAT
jgi:hypothetical protein